MKQKTILLLPALLPMLLFAQDKPVQKLINGNPCDTCVVKYNLNHGNVLPYALIGATVNPDRLYSEYEAFKKSIPDQPFEQNACLLYTSPSPRD